MAKWIVSAVGFLCLTGCVENVGTNPHDTGGGGISWYENHSARKPGAAGTGSSAVGGGYGGVAGGGIQDTPGNRESASESNGGQGTHGNPNGLL